MTRHQLRIQAAVAAAITAALMGATVPATASPTTIMEVQGTGHTSPFAGMAVTVEGVVTATRTGVSPRGFYLQDPVGDGDSATSNGIFVFTSSAPTVGVGDHVSVAGRVVEFRPGGAASANLTTTQLSSPGLSVTVLSSGNPVPAPLPIPQPPTEVIYSGPAGDIEATGAFEPSNNGIDFYETFEGMLMKVEDPLAVSARNPFGEIAVVSEGWTAGSLSSRGAIVVRQDDFNPERVIVDDQNFLPAASTPATDTGDGFAAPLVGVMDYSFGNFKLQLTEMPTVVSAGLSPETTAAPADQELAVATFNVLNLAPIPQDAAQMAAIARQIVENLRSPDLITLQEMQDANGEVDDGTTDGAPTFQALIDEIVAADGPLYEFRQIDPLDNQDGGVPGGNIRVGFLFRTDRGLSFIDRPGGDAATATQVVATSSGPQLTLSPGRVDPQNLAWFQPEGTRKPLAGEFRFRGKKLFVVVNHLKSKTGDQPLFGRFQPPEQVTVPQRVEQAQIVNDFVDEILAIDPKAHVIVIGDFNDFHFSDAVTTLKGGVLTNLMETLPESERYTFVFDGNAQTLDHILVSPRIAAGSPVFDIVHVNAEFAVQASDHEAAVARIRLIGRP